MSCVGTERDGVLYFQNIFYAQDTCGPNRFAPPVNFEPARGSVIDATQSGAWCSQIGDISSSRRSSVNASENCLSLRIAVPSDIKADAKLPVVVFIHGGDHVTGSAYDGLFEPDSVIKEAVEDGQPLIWVAINYRLGFFGFASSEALKDAGHTNVGLRDQRAAFEWVQEHIAAFGGDPGRITAMGEGSGASDIGLHLTAFNGKRGVPFQNVILQSGAPSLYANSRPDLAIETTAAIADQVDCVKDEDPQSAATLACLRQTPAEHLTQISSNVARTAHPPFGKDFFSPTIDDDMITDRPLELVRAGKVTPRLSIMGSWNTDDGTRHVPLTVSTDADVLATLHPFLPSVSNATQSELLKLYPISDVEQLHRRGIEDLVSPQYHRAARINRDLRVTCPLLDFTFHYAKQCGIKPPVDQVFLCEVNMTRSASTYHRADLQSVQSLQPSTTNTNADLETAKRISRAIATFAHHQRNDIKDRWTTCTPDPSDFLWGDAFPLLSASSYCTTCETREELSPHIRRELEEDMPSRLQLMVFGEGGAGESVLVRNGEDDFDKEVEKAVVRERLFERCGFITNMELRGAIGA